MEIPALLLEHGGWRTSSSAYLVAALFLRYISWSKSKPVDLNSTIALDESSFERCEMCCP